MAHAFQIMDDTNTVITYTDYDSIPLGTLKHVISFIPDIGTLVDSNEIVIDAAITSTAFDINTMLILDVNSNVLKYLYGAITSNGADLLVNKSSQQVEAILNLLMLLERLYPHLHFQLRKQIQAPLV